MNFAWNRFVECYDLSLFSDQNNILKHTVPSTAVIAHRARPNFFRSTELGRTILNVRYYFFVWFLKACAMSITCNIVKSARSKNYLKCISNERAQPHQLPFGMTFYKYIFHEFVEKKNTCSTSTRRVREQLKTHA